MRERYAEAATTTCGCCGPSAGQADRTVLEEHEREVFGASQYADEDRDALPEDAKAVSLGCGNPTAVAQLNEGETVLDLGSGGGIDVLLSARRVGQTGKALRPGHDRRDARPGPQERGRGRRENVEFVKGTIEEIPLADASVDVIISNCVINLSGRQAPDAARGRPGAQARRALRRQRRDRRRGHGRGHQARHGRYTGCIAGALTEREFEQALPAAGFEDVEIRETHRVHDSAASAIVRAVKPMGVGPR